MSGVSAVTLTDKQSRFLEGFPDSDKRSFFTRVLTADPSVIEEVKVELNSDSENRALAHAVVLSRDEDLIRAAFEIPFFQAFIQSEACPWVDIIETKKPTLVLCKLESATHLSPYILPALTLWTCAHDVLPVLSALLTNGARDKLELSPGLSSCLVGDTDGIWSNAETIPAECTANGLNALHLTLLTQDETALEALFAHLDPDSLRDLATQLAAADISVVNILGELLNGGNLFALYALRLCLSEGYCDLDNKVSHIFEGDKNPTLKQMAAKYLLQLDLSVLAVGLSEQESVALDELYIRLSLGQITQDQLNASLPAHADQTLAHLLADYEVVDPGSDSEGEDTGSAKTANVITFKESQVCSLWSLMVDKGANLFVKDSREAFPDDIIKEAGEEAVCEHVRILMQHQGHTHCQQIAVLKDLARTLRDVKASAEKCIDALKEKLEGSVPRIEFEGFQGQLAMLQSMLESGQAHIEKQSKMIQEQRLELQRKEVELQKQQALNRLKDKSVERLQAALSKKRTPVKELEAQLAAVSEQRLSLEAQLAKSEAKVARLSEGLKAQQEKHAEALATQKARLTDGRKAAVADRERKMAELQREISDFKGRLATAVVSVEQADRAGRVAEAKTAAAEATTLEMRAQIASLETAHGGVVKAIKAEREKVCDLQQQVSQLTRERDAANETAEQVGGLMETCGRFEGNLERSEVARREQALRIQALEAELEKRPATVLKASAEPFQPSPMVQQGLYSEMTSRAEAAEARAQRFQEMNVALGQDNAALRQGMAEKQQWINHYGEELARLKRELQMANQDLAAKGLRDAHGNATGCVGIPLPGGRLLSVPLDVVPPSCKLETYLPTPHC